VFVVVVVVVYFVIDSVRKLLDTPPYFEGDKQGICEEFWYRNLTENGF
jgi:hypothetical protein